MGQSGFTAIESIDSFTETKLQLLFMGSVFLYRKLYGPNRYDIVKMTSLHFLCSSFHWVCLARCIYIKNNDVRLWIIVSNIIWKSSSKSAWPLCQVHSFSSLQCTYSTSAEQASHISCHCTFYETVQHFRNVKTTLLKQHPRILSTPTTSRQMIRLLQLQ